MSTISSALFLRHEVFSALISDILCPEMTEQVICFLLPSLAEPSCQFPFGFLLETLLSLLSKGGDSGGSNIRVNPSPWLLYGVLAFVDKHLGIALRLNIDFSLVFINFKLLFQSDL